MTTEARKIVVLAGAGLSYDAGLPLSVALAGKLREYLDQSADGVDEVTHRVHRSLYNLIVGGIRFQQGLLDKNPDDPVNIEQIATAALRLAGRHENPIAPYVSVWHPRLSEIEDEHPGSLGSFLSTMYGQLRRWLTPPPGADLGYLASLADLHSERASVDVFTLNYDLCFEKAFVELADRKFANGFPDGVWRADGLAKAVDIRLVKLHGSLDWVDDTSGYGICSLDYPRHAQAEELEGNSPLLIFGTDQKMTSRDPFLTMFYLFSDVLRNCAALIVIGYSFSDDHINQIIEQRFRENIPMRMLVVAPRASQQVQSRDWLANPSRVHAIDAGAKAAINEKKVAKWVNQVLKSMTDDKPF